MAVQRAVAERWQQVTGTPLIEGYGMTESSPVLTVNPVDNTMRIGTIGVPVPSTDMRIVDDKGNSLPPGPDHVGEIVARGPQIMKGYWQHPDATAETVKDGWLYTGDMGYMHPDGFFQIVDRKKDMILVSGFNVYPNEIEEVIAHCRENLTGYKVPRQVEFRTELPKSNVGKILRRELREKK